MDLDAPLYNNHDQVKGHISPACFIWGIVKADAYGHGALGGSKALNRRGVRGLGVVGVVCLTLRDNTERPVTIERGTNVLVGTSRERIIAADRKALTGPFSESGVPDLWDGKAAERIATILQNQFKELSEVRWPKPAFW